MRTSVIAAAAALVVAAQTSVSAQTQTSPRAAVLATARQFIDGFNKGDVASALAACAEETSIIDEFPPYEWHGAGACAKWASDYDADAKKNGITGGNVTMGRAIRVDIAGDRAYVVLPTGYTYKQQGKPMQETGSLLTVALQKGANGWRITGWSWTRR